MTSHRTLERSTFERLRATVYSASGISLGDRKQALVAARVGRRMRELGIESYDEYVAYLEADGEEIVALLDNVSTNVTSFFREPAHFDVLVEAAKGRVARGQRRLRYWSAACSTGEEPLSLAMALLEAVGDVPGLDLRILATDLSTRVLAHCQRGVYTDERMAGVSAQRRGRWFTPVRASSEGVSWQARTTLTDVIVYRRLNLAETPLPIKGPLDGVLCRNVMIYFDEPVRSRLIADVHRMLAPEGLFIVGHSESLIGGRENLLYRSPSVYTRG
jgi:chemotaxis protein methyltransferase CheR